LTDVEPQSYTASPSSKGNLMDTRIVTAVGFSVAFGAGFSACSSSPTAPSTSSITVTGSVPAVGQTSQLTAKAILSNGTLQDVTTQAMWSSSNTAVATVTSSGLLKVLQVGAADITATYQSVSGRLSVSLSVTSVSGTCQGTRDAVRCAFMGTFTVAAAGAVDASATVTGFSGQMGLVILGYNPASTTGSTCSTQFLTTPLPVSAVSTTPVISGHWDSVPVGAYCMNVSIVPVPDTIPPYSWTATVTHS
jgi:hypothetical protein